MRRYFAACTLGVEDALAAELRELAAHDIGIRPGGVSFAGDQRLGYAANLWLRSAVYVQDEVVRGEARSPEQLYDLVRTVDWSGLMGVDQTLSVDAAVRDSHVTHSKYAALKVKDAIVDQLRERFGRRPSVDVEAADLPLKLVIRRDGATLYRNLSGAPLHKRGWRPIQVKSPLNEATAAGLLRLTGWDRNSPLVDPMCGSGTFVIEAACLAADVAPGIRRVFPFETWPDFDQKTWRELRAEAEARVKPSLPFTIEGADHHAGALAIAQKSAAAADVAHLVRFVRSEARDYSPSAPPRTVVVNPPYGERLGEGEELFAAWRDLGSFLHRCHGASAYVLSGNAEMTRHLGLRASRKWVVRNGPIDCRWLEYEVA